MSESNNTSLEQPKHQKKQSPSCSQTPVDYKASDDKANNEKE
jgi:hypothetical protein